jgi:hypothetical protein
MPGHDLPEERSGSSGGFFYLSPPLLRLSIIPSPKLGADNERIKTMANLLQALASVMAQPLEGTAEGDASLRWIHKWAKAVYAGVSIQSSDE